MEHHEAIRTMAAERYLLEEMTDDERDTFEAHFFDCAVCADSVRTGAALADATRRGDAASAAFAAPRKRSPILTFVPMAAAAMLALVAGYQSLVTIPALRSQLEAPQALAPIALAPVSRGDGATVPLAGQGRGVTFALDINIAAPGPRLLDYDLRTDAGVVVLSGQAPVPPQGTPLLLLMPGTTLTAGQYAIVVRDSAAPNDEIGTYRFTVR